ncbi:MAG: glycosyltransferase family 4 protein [Planctomycetes bacterium]|nr:glycosyltransferase family 4 protein [Planctomycetota bacterium]
MTARDLHAPLHDLTVGFLIDRWEPERGGAERSLAGFAAWLAQRGTRVLAFARTASSTAPGEFARVRAGGLTRSGRERRLAERLVRAADEAGCDVTIGIRHLSRVDVYWPHGGAWLPSLAARAAARGEPCVDARELVRGRFATFRDFERELCRGGARFIVCVSRLVEDEFAAEYPGARERLVRIENGVDLERFSPQRRATLGMALRAELGLGPRLGLERALGLGLGEADVLSLADSSREPLLAFVAREPELKGLETALHALARLATRPWRLVVAGPKSCGRWQRLARELGLDSRIVWRRDVDAAALLCAADLCLAPTFRDTSGLVILEALASGTPVITTANAGAADVLTAPEHGVVLPRAGDPGALAAALAARLDAPAPPRERVREAVAGRDAARTFERLGELVQRAATAARERRGAAD